MNDTLLTIDELRNVGRKFHREVMKKAIPFAFFSRRIFIKSFSTGLYRPLDPLDSSLFFQLLNFIYLFSFFFFFFVAACSSVVEFSREYATNAD